MPSMTLTQIILAVFAILYAATIALSTLHIVKDYVYGSHTISLPEIAWLSFSVMLETVLLCLATPYAHWGAGAIALAAIGTPLVYAGTLRFASHLQRTRINDPFPLRQSAYSLGLFGLGFVPFLGSFYV